MRLTPRASRTALGGRVTEADGAVWLQARVTAPPEDGKANTALLALLAKALDVPVSACSLVAGAGSRRKRVRIEGDPEALGDRLARLVADRESREDPEHGSIGHRRTAARG